MKILKILGVTTAVVVGSLGLASSASAYDGCGWGYHMNRWGECRPNYRPYGFYGPRPVYFGGWHRGHHHHHHHGFGHGHFRGGFGHRH